MIMGLQDKEKKEQIVKNKSFISSLEFALQGFKTVFKEERNMRSHVIFGGLTLLAGLVCQLSLPEWLWLVLAIFLVVVMEIINTTVENIVDMVTDYHFHSIGKKVKDMAAAAVLLTAGFAVFVGLLLFLPKIWQWFL